ncbi:MAG: type-F conjugative transfer system protein TraW [Pseudomonadales bacterium]|nr:type-F conjugative transfer system protein TraW [Pseudomonadales bacterium]
MRAVLLAVLFACFNSAIAEDLGVLGKVYPIQEESLIEAIKARLSTMQESGELAEKHEELLEQSRQYAQRPPGVDLPRATEYRAVPVDPSFTLSRDIVDAEGKVLFEKGLVINPLKYRPLTRAICFLDGDDGAQVEWLADACPSSENSKVVLVNGNVVELMKSLQRRLYFDQHGTLVARFEITALPAVVRQSEEILYVEQFPIQ